MKKFVQIWTIDMARGEIYLPVRLLLDPSSKSLEPEPSIFIEPIEPKAARVFMLTFCTR